MLGIGQVRQFGRQLLRSVAYLHDLSLVHTDLKPENIMLESGEYDKFIQPGRRSPAPSPQLLHHTVNLHPEIA